VLGIVRSIGQQAIEVDVAAGLPDGGGKLRGILGRPPTDKGSGPEMGLAMAGHRQLGPMQQSATLLALAPDVVATDMAALQAGGINDRLGFGADELELAGSPQDCAEQGVKSPFFRSRCSA
jgi:hypothetical protein